MPGPMQRTICTPQAVHRVSDLCKHKIGIAERASTNAATHLKAQCQPVRLLIHERSCHKRRSAGKNRILASAQRRRQQRAERFCSFSGGCHTRMRVVKTRRRSRPGSVCQACLQLNEGTCTPQVTDHLLGGATLSSEQPI